jgi:predicted amidophosphoribosyltransferase
VECPFCGAAATAPRCVGCGRDPTASRRVCSACQRLTPKAATACVHCGAAAASDLWWQVPLIVLMFAAAAVLAFVIAMHQ